VIPTLLGILGLLLAGSVLPNPWREGMRAGLAFYVVFSPLVALAAFLSTQDVEPGTWLLFLPLTIVWCITMDLRFGVSRRLARRRNRHPGP
jgi:hypothetical protein